MSKIKIVDLEVFYCVGVTDEEWAKPQRLLLTIDMTFDFSAAAVGDQLSQTIDYFAVSQDLLSYGTGRKWRLIEKVAMNIAELVMSKYRPESVWVEVKKFVIPQASYVSVAVSL